MRGEWLTGPPFSPDRQLADGAPERSLRRLCVWLTDSLDRQYESGCKCVEVVLPFTAWRKGEIMLRQMVVACAMLACGEQAYADRCRELIATVKSGTAVAPSVDAPAQEWCDYVRKYNDEARRSIEAKREYERRNCRKIVGLEFSSPSSKDAAVLNSKFVPMEKSYCADAAAERVAAERAQPKPPPLSPSPPDRSSPAPSQPPSSGSSSSNSRPQAPVVIPVPVPTPPKAPQRQVTAELQGSKETPAADKSACMVSISHRHSGVYEILNECVNTKKWIVLELSEYETKKCVRQVIGIPADSFETTLSYHGKAPEIRFQCSEGGNCQPKKLVARFGRDC